MSMPMTGIPLVSAANTRFNNNMANTMVDAINMDGSMESLENDLYQSPNQNYNHDFKPTFYDPFEVKHRRRTTRAQFKVLEKTFQENPKPSATIRRLLAQRLNMTPRGVQVWFQNRRAKAKLQSQQDKQRGIETSSSSDSTKSTDAWAAEDYSPMGDNDFPPFSIYNNNSNMQNMNPPYFSDSLSPQMKAYYSNGGPMLSGTQKKSDPIQFMSNDSFQGFQFQEHDHSHLRAAFSSLHDESPSIALLRRNSCPANMISNMLPMHMMQPCSIPKLPGNNFLSAPVVPAKMRRWSAVNAGIMTDQEQLSFMNSMPQSSEAYNPPCTLSPAYPSWDVDSASSVSSSPSCLQLSMPAGASSPAAEAISTTPLPLSFHGSIQASDTMHMQMSQLQCAIDSFSV